MRKRGKGFLAVTIRIAIMVNFLCQLDRATECPDIGLNIPGYVCEDVSR